MARQNHGPLSRAKGKLGGVVYQQYEGMQISREYQPVVKNPQTSKQVENRAKFKLASQLVAQFSEVINTRLALLSIYTRKRRGAAVNAIYNVVSTSTPAQPSVLVGGVVDAINSKSISGVPGPVINGSTGAITMAAGYTVVYTHCTYDTSTGILTGRTVETYTSDGATKSVELDARQRNVIMAVAFRSLTEEGAAMISNISNNSTGWTNEITRGINSGDIEVTNVASVIA